MTRFAAMLDAQIDHVAIAVRSVAAAKPFFLDALGASFLFAGDNVGQSFRWAQFRFPHGGKIELVTPIGDDGFVQRFLDKRGEGVHHITLKVPDIVTAIAHLEATGIQLVNVSIDHPSWKEAFVHPRDAHGVLVQVVQSAFSDEDTAEHHLADHGDADHSHLSLAELLA